jgi:two-component system, NtrC family, sensor histidine kinase HydH
MKASADSAVKPVEELVVTRNSAPANPASSWSSFPWMLGAYASFALTIVAVLVIAGWGVYIDFQESRKSLLQSEINRVRSHALRTTLRLQTSLGETPGGDLSVMKQMPWLRDHWETFTKRDPSRLYSAVIDKHGTIIAHSDPQFEGGRLPAGWYESAAEDVGDDAVITAEPKLTGGGRALDVSLPIEYASVEVATYHSGFDLSRFEEQLDLQRSAVRRRWGLAFAFISIVIALAGLSLLHITRRLTSLQSALAMGHVRRLADLGQLAGGIAHEVRNPLNAIRLNLHVIERLLEGHDVADDRTRTIINESVREMERVDGLLRMLLNYARPDTPRSERVNLCEELPTVADFIRPIIERDGVRLDVDADADPCVVSIDRSRFRQIVINLLKNAAEAAGPDGRVAATLRTVDGKIELTIRDSGAGVDPRLRERIFEPFFTTKDVGTGLGLSLAKRYVEEAGGEIEVRNAAPHGAEFVVRLPLSTAAVKIPEPDAVAVAESA